MTIADQYDYAIADKGLVLLSGGQDSATCLAMARQECEMLYSVTFYYGQRHRLETEYARTLSRFAKVNEHFVLEIQDTFNQFSLSSALLNTHQSMSSPSRKNKELPASFVPGRNYILLGLASILAYELDVTRIYAGMNQEDFSGYPDCRAETINAINIAIEKSLDFPIKIICPLMYMTKKEIVRKMYELDCFDWYAFTLTCYEGLVPPCRKCSSCRLRAKGFKEAGFEDPLLE